MIQNPLTGFRHFDEFCTLVHPQETNPREAERALPHLSPDPPPEIDLLENPGADCGTAFRHSGWAPIRKRIGRAFAECDVSSSRLDRFHDCGKGAWVVLDPNDRHNYRVMAHYCHDRFCGPCAAMRGRTIATNLLGALDDRPLRMVTFTLRSKPEEPLKPLIDRLYWAFAMIRRTALWGKCVDGGAAILEVKHIAHTRRWHPHLHVLAHGKYLPKGEIEAEWLRITRDSYIVDVRLIHDHGKVAHYVTKYVSKPGDYSTLHSTDLLAEMIVALKGRRLCATFGTWRGLKLLQAPEAVDWIYVDSLYTLNRRANDGDAEAERILRIIRRDASDVSADPHLPFPDE